MNKTICDTDGWKPDGTQKFKRVSRWIKVRENYNPCRHNSLWNYVEDENGYKPYQNNFNSDNGLYLHYFKWNGKTWAIEQFLCLGNPFYMPVAYSYEDKNGKLNYLSAVDGDNYYNPIFVEFDEYCEHVRVYREL